MLEVKTTFDKVFQEMVQLLPLTLSTLDLRSFTLDLRSFTIFVLSSSSKI